MFRRIFLSIFITAFCAVLLLEFFTARSFYLLADERSGQELKNIVESVSVGLQYSRDEEKYLEGLPRDCRMTLIARDGSVLFDNEAAASGMENHFSRPEVLSAAEKGMGQSFRFSGTLTEETLYYALRLPEGRILRASRTQHNILGLAHRNVLPLFIIGALLGFSALLLARGLARRITAPLGKIDLNAPLESDSYDELSPLLVHLSRQNAQLKEQLKALEEQRQKIEAITENMSEGLVILDREGMILSINRSAAALFQVQPADCVGQNILTVNRSLEIHDLLREGREGRTGLPVKDAFLHIKGRIYQLLAAPVNVGEERAMGCALFLLDVTAREEAEQNRREFTANVSHELRTPLTSIAGYSEIMSTGLARSEDFQGFAKKIYDETQRLIAMVKNIMELSRLDEQAELPHAEDVDLCVLCSNVARRLQPMAEEKQIALTFHGDPASIWGVSSMLDEMVFNLAENALKYNHPGGTAEIELRSRGGAVELSVKDSGIGIPPEHQDHVFERFYRVDKSRSKATGGTGLGLAIVKHIAAIHGASVSLQSEPGRGSCFIVRFQEHRA